MPSNLAKKERIKGEVSEWVSEKEAQWRHIVAIWNYFFDLTQLLKISLSWDIFRNKNSKTKCNQNAPVPLIPLCSLSNFNDIMKIFGFLTGSPPLMSCHYMMSLDNSVRPSHCVWSTKANDLPQLESRHQIFWWKCAASPVGVELSSLQVSQLTSVSDHDYQSQEQALSKGTSGRKWKATNTPITYRSLIVFSSAERPFVWAKSCSDDPAVGEAKKSPLQVELCGGLWRQ